MARTLIAGWSKERTGYSTEPRTLAAQYVDATQPLGHPRIIERRVRSATAELLREQPAGFGRVEVRGHVLPEQEIVVPELLDSDDAPAARIEDGPPVATHPCGMQLLEPLGCDRAGEEDVDLATAAAAILGASSAR